MSPLKYFGHIGCILCKSFMTKKNVCDKILNTKPTSQQLTDVKFDVWKSGVSVQLWISIELQLKRHKYQICKNYPWKTLNSINKKSYYLNILSPRPKIARRGSFIVLFCIANQARETSPGQWFSQFRKISYCSIKSCKTLCSWFLELIARFVFVTMHFQHTASTVEHAPEPRGLQFTVLAMRSMLIIIMHIIILSAWFPVAKVLKFAVFL